MTPTILFVPGYWEGPVPFERVITLLISQGYLTEITELVSTGTTSPGNPSMLDDIAGIRLAVQKLVEEDEKDVVLVVHSIAGMLGPCAIEGLGSKARSDAGLKGGVRKIVFLAALVTPEGFTHAPLPFFEYDGGARYCKTPEKLLFNDLDAVAAEKWVKLAGSQVVRCNAGHMVQISMPEKVAEVVKAAAEEN
ncbi:hypothetical protein LAWI1_G005211 [Lachnellula willkommii]|uniref:AB hydrolase-1 domain-containing protein n=1 Tax=Lachnellula willkommii TaxID=215461 RepID=A0A559M765_9HELO|nr:hypothetical protein LAWI1_G005211 [Lachnellula willkommii]